MITIEDKTIVLFRLHDTKIYTNPPEDRSAASRHVSSLGFSLINVSENELLLDGAQGACLSLSFLSGASSQSLFPADAGDADLGAIHGPEGWNPSQLVRNPVKKNHLRMLLSPREDLQVRLPPGQAVSFSWQGIVTDTPEGYCSLSLSFSGIPALEGTFLTQPLYKECIHARLSSFYASPSGGAPGDRIRLYWNVENAESGSILPMGTDIFPQKGPALASLDTVLTENTHYYLNIDNRHGNVYQKTHAQLIPPSIAAFSLEPGRKLSWETHFTTSVQLKTAGGYRDVDRIGSCTLEEGLRTASLRCMGLYTLERHLAFPACTGISSFFLDLWTFPSHLCAILTWKTAYARALELRVWDNACYTLPPQESGCYEQVYDLDTSLSFQLHYEGDAGTETLFFTNSSDSEVDRHVPGY